MRQRKELLNSLADDYEVYVNQLFRKARKQNLSRFDSEEIVYDTIAHFLDKLQKGGFDNLKIDNEPKNFIKNFLHKTGKFKIIDRIDERSKTVSTNEFIGHDPPIVDIIEQEKIHNEIEKLPDLQKMCIRLFYFDDLKIKNIANRLEITESNVKTNLCRARKKLSKKLRLVID